jgi:hypothetical protein
MAWTDFIGPIINIAGQALAKSGSDEKASAGARTQAALSSSTSKTSASRISEHARFVTGFIDPRVDVKSGRGAVADSGEAFRFALSGGGGDLTENQNVALKSLISRLEQSQQRA